MYTEEVNADSLLPQTALKVVLHLSSLSSEQFLSFVCLEITGQFRPLNSKVQKAVKGQKGRE